MLHGTNFVNFVGYNAWVGGENGIEAIQVTEWDEPASRDWQLSSKISVPTGTRIIRKPGAELRKLWPFQPGVANCLQLRGEYLFVAEGKGGFQAYDVASIANEGISQRIITCAFLAFPGMARGSERERDLHGSANGTELSRRNETRAT